MTLASCNVGVHAYLALTLLQTFTLLCCNVKQGTLLLPHASVGKSVFVHGVQPAATRGGGGAGGRINARNAAVPGPSAVGLGCVEL